MKNPGLEHSLSQEYVTCLTDTVHVYSIHMFLTPLNLSPKCLQAQQNRSESMTQSGGRREFRAERAECCRSL